MSKELFSEQYIKTSKEEGTPDFKLDKQLEKDFIKYGTSKPTRESRVLRISHE